jgi:hypothetical protein
VPQNSVRRSTSRVRRMIPAMSMTRHWRQEEPGEYVQSTTSLPTTSSETAGSSGSTQTPSRPVSRAKSATRGRLPGSHGVGNDRSRLLGVTSRLPSL